MDLGFKVRALIWKEMGDNFPTTKEQGLVFQNALCNIVCNIVFDSSVPGKERANLQEVINALQKWLDKPKTGSHVTYNPETQEFTKEEIH